MAVTTAAGLAMAVPPVMAKKSVPVMVPVVITGVAVMAAVAADE